MRGKETGTRTHLLSHVFDDEITTMATATIPALTGVRRIRERLSCSVVRVRSPDRTVVARPTRSRRHVAAPVRRTSSVVVTQPALVRRRDPDRRRL